MASIRFKSIRCSGEIPPGGISLEVGTSRHWITPVKIHKSNALVHFPHSARMKFQTNFALEARRIVQKKVIKNTPQTSKSGPRGPKLPPMRPRGLPRRRFKPFVSIFDPIGSNHTLTTEFEEGFTVYLEYSVVEDEDLTEEE